MKKHKLDKVFVATDADEDGKKVFLCLCNQNEIKTCGPKRFHKEPTQSNKNLMHCNTVN